MLIDDITYATLALKQYCVAFSNDLFTKESYGEEECEDCWIKAILACRYIAVFEDYLCDIQNNLTPCLCEDEMMNYLQLASNLYNGKGCGCG